MTFAFVFESVGGTEWLVLLGVTLIVVGPKNLPSAARKVGEITTRLRRAADEFKRQLMTMDQEVRSTVDSVVNEVKDSYTDVPDSSSGKAAAAGDGDRAEEYDPYSEGNPYPGHGDGSYEEPPYDPVQAEPAESAASVAKETPPEPSSEPRKPTEEELRAVKITVSKA